MLEPVTSMYPLLSYVSQTDTKWTQAASHDAHDSVSVPDCTLCRLPLMTGLSYPHQGGDTSSR